MRVFFGDDVQTANTFAQHFDCRAFLLTRLDSSLQGWCLSKLSHLVGLLLEWVPEVLPGRLNGVSVVFEVGLVFSVADDGSLTEDTRLHDHGLSGLMLREDGRQLLQDLCWVRLLLQHLHLHLRHLWYELLKGIGIEIKIGVRVEVEWVHVVGTRASVTASFTDSCLLGVEHVLSLLKLLLEAIDLLLLLLLLGEEADSTSALLLFHDG